MASNLATGTNPQLVSSSLDGNKSEKFSPGSLVCKSLLCSTPKHERVFSAKRVLTVSFESHTKNTPTLARRHPHRTETELHHCGASTFGNRWGRCARCAQSSEDKWLARTLPAALSGWYSRSLERSFSFVSPPVRWGVLGKTTSNLCEFFTVFFSGMMFWFLSEPSVFL